VPAGTRRLAIGLFVLLASVYALTGSGHTSSPDEEGMLAQARSVVAGRAEIRIDASNADVTSRRVEPDGTAVGVSGLGQSVAGIPLLAVGSAVGNAVPAGKRLVVENLVVLFTNSFVTAGTAVVLFFLAMRLGAPPRRSALLALAFGLGTYAWPHARTFFSEPLTALCVLGAVGQAVACGDSPDGSWRRAAASGVLIGLAVNVRTTAGLFPPLLFVYLLFVVWRRVGRTAAVRAGVAFGVAGAALLVVLLASYWWRFGSPTDLGPASVPFLYPLRQGLWNLYFSPGKSLFLYAPVVAVAVVGLPLALRRRPPETLLLLGIVGANTVLFARFLAGHGDQAWGPRYLQIVLPCAVALAAPVLAGGVAWARAVGVATVVGALWPAALGILISPNAYFQQGNAILTGRIDHNGERHYINAFHFDPYWSPLLGHARMLPSAAATTFHRLGGPTADMGRLPSGPSDRYFWFDFLNELDVWWLWLPAAELPAGLLALGPVFIGGAAAGGVVLTSGLRDVGAATAR
jgi:hypothetical protein